MSELVMMPQKDYKDICDAVRAKTGGTELLKSGDLKAQIESIQSGGGSSASVPWNDVTFIDYDGTVLHSYTLEEAQALTELPPLPEQKGLICQGWNWSLEDIKAQNGPVIVGAMYITDDGKTRIYTTLQEGRTSPMLGVCPNGTVTVDWGDGTEPDVLTGTSLTTVKWTPTHEYASAGDYVISLSVDGEMGFSGVGYNNYFSELLRYTSGQDGRNRVYQNSVNKIEVGEGITSIGEYAFNNCYALSNISIPSGVTSIGNNAFNNCQSLSNISIPSGVTSIGTWAFASCYAVRYLDFSACTSVPTLANTNAFTGIPADCQMLIPSALFDEWSTATNWATYASYMVAV